MTYTPIPNGTDPWGDLVNSAFVDQDNRITQNANDISTNQTNISNLTSSLGTTNSNVTNVQNGLATANSNIGTLQTQMTTANGNISTLQGQVTTLVNNAQNPAAAQGFLSWNYDSEAAVSSNALSLGSVWLHKIWLPAGATINNLGFTILTAGSALTYARIALYTAAGTQVAISADQSSSWNSNGYKNVPLVSGYAVPANGYYYVGILTTGTTAPIGASSNGVQTGFNANLTAATLRHALVATGQTALPASITMSGNSSTGTSTWITAS